MSGILLIRLLYQQSLGIGESERHSPQDLLSLQEKIGKLSEHDLRGFAVLCYSKYDEIFFDLLNLLYSQDIHLSNKEITHLYIESFLVLQRIFSKYFLLECT